MNLRVCIKIKDIKIFLMKADLEKRIFECFLSLLKRYYSANNLT